MTCVCKRVGKKKKKNLKGDAESFGQKRSWAKNLGGGNNNTEE